MIYRESEILTIDGAKSNISVRSVSTLVHFLIAYPSRSSTMTDLRVVFVVLGVVLSGVHSYKILGILPIPSKSHYYVGHSLLKGLALEGHEVTVMSPFREKNPIPNYSEVFLENSWKNSREGNRCLKIAKIPRLQIIFYYLRRHG